MLQRNCFLPLASSHCKKICRKFYSYLALRKLFTCAGLFWANAIIKLGLRKVVFIKLQTGRFKNTRKTCKQLACGLLLKSVSCILPTSLEGLFILAQLINPKFFVSRPHRRSTTVSLETNPLVCLNCFINFFLEDAVQKERNFLVRIQ